MKTLQYKVELLSDVILNQKAATEGPNNTLDFIPGGCFLGIAAKTVYSQDSKDAWAILHSGQVRFADAHPAHGEVRTLRVPAMLMHPKLDDNRYLVSAAIPEDEQTKEDMRKLQLKQCRSGFYDFSEQLALKVELDTDFAIKSAHDKNSRTSKDSAMYGYESLPKGAVFYFSVEMDDDKFEKIINDALCGIQHIGRSRSAQYGLVKITPYIYKSCDNIVIDVKTDGVYVYAEGRLIFLDGNGLPAFTPTAKDLGFEKGEVNWQKSQVRTFQYAPWNAKRQCFDADRCGIEKGSVFVVDNVSTMPQRHYVGVYQNEGFGKIIYNPAFLNADANGNADYQLAKDKKQSKDSHNDNPKISEYKSDLINYLVKEKENRKVEFDIYKAVNVWVDENAKYFRSKEFASQWGTIRSLASLRSVNIQDKLFNDKTGYLMHGIAQEKWAEGGRINKLKSFIDSLPVSMDDEDVRIAILNLAAEMAKRCRKEN